MASTALLNSFWTSQATKPTIVKKEEDFKDRECQQSFWVPSQAGNGGGSTRKKHFSLGAQARSMPPTVNCRHCTLQDLFLVALDLSRHPIEFLPLILKAKSYRNGCRGEETTSNLHRTHTQAADSHLTRLKTASILHGGFDAE